MRTLILSCILSLFPLTAFADDLELGRYTCTVKTTRLVAIEDGVANEYRGFKDGLKVGDKLIFEIKKFQGEDSKGLKFILTNPKDDDFLFLTFIINAVFDEYWKAIRDVADQYTVESRIDEDVMLLSNGTLSMFRYFRSDYSLMFVDLPSRFSQNSLILTADCRANTHAFPALYDYVNE